jgi:hypothetical protein
MKSPIEKMNDKWRLLVYLHYVKGKITKSTIDRMSKLYCYSDDKPSKFIQEADEALKMVGRGEIALAKIEMADAEGREDG